jgi:DNA-binding NtrC family response regulator
MLKKYHWPGNIRELRNVCEHVSAMRPGQHIESGHLPPDLAARTAKPGSSGFELPQEGLNME